MITAKAAEQGLNDTIYACLSQIVGKRDAGIAYEAVITAKILMQCMNLFHSTRRHILIATWLYHQQHATIVTVLSHLIDITSYQQSKLHICCADHHYLYQHFELAYDAHWILVSDIMHDAIKINNLSNHSLITRYHRMKHAIGYQQIHDLRLMFIYETTVALTQAKDSMKTKHGKFLIRYPYNCTSDFLERYKRQTDIYEPNF